MYEFQFFSILYIPKVCNLPKWFVAINEPVYIYDSASNENYYLLKNDQNTVLALYKASDTAGSAPREQYEYSSYGITNILDGSGVLKTFDHDLNVNTPEIKQVKSDWLNPFGYQGMWRDEHTGLYHTHYRLYDPQHVRWLTPDPAGYRDGQNLYRFYAGPNGVDPLGLEDAATCRRYIDEAKETFKRVQYRYNLTKSGFAGANSAAYLAETLRLYDKYQSQKKGAFCQIDAYTQNASSINWRPYNFYEEAFKLGDVQGLGSGSRGSRYQNVDFIHENIDNNITSINSYLWSGEALGAAGWKLLAVTGVAGLGRSLVAQVYRNRKILVALYATLELSSRRSNGRSNLDSSVTSFVRWTCGEGSIKEHTFFAESSVETDFVKNSPIGKLLEEKYLSTINTSSQHWASGSNIELKWKDIIFDWFADNKNGINYYAFFVGSGIGAASAEYDSQRGVMRVKYTIVNPSTLSSATADFLPEWTNVEKPYMPFSHWNQSYSWTKEYPVGK